MHLLQLSLFDTGPGPIPGGLEEGDSMCTAHAYRTVSAEFHTILEFRPRTGQSKPAPRHIAVNERGLRIGESHPGAVLSNHEVDLLLELRDEGFSYSWLATKFEVSKGTVAKICTGQRRCQHPVAWRRCAR